MTKYYVAYDTSGAVVTRYDSSINAAQIASPPAGLSLLEVPDQATMLSTVPPGWTVVNGVLTAPPARTAAQLLTEAQAAQIAGIKAGFVSATAAIPFTINGTTYTLDAAQSKQAADMAIVVAANNALNHPVAWAASTSVAQYAIQLVGSSYLFCTVAGTTGTTAPTPPTTFGTTVTDGTVTWELYGRTLEMSDGTHATFTVQELISIFQQVEVYIHYQKNQKLSLLAQIAAATTVSAVQAIVW